MNIPNNALVLMVGTSSSGKSTFAKNHFLPSQIVSSDRLRWMISDDENNQSVSPEAFSILYSIVRARLKNNKLTVVDATNLATVARKKFILMANSFAVPIIAIVMKTSETTIWDRSNTRTDRTIPEEALNNQLKAYYKTLETIENESFDDIIYVNDNSKAIEHLAKFAEYCSKHCVVDENDELHCNCPFYKTHDGWINCEITGYGEKHASPCFRWKDLK